MPSLREKGMEVAHTSAKKVPSTGTSSSRRRYTSESRKAMVFKVPEILSGVHRGKTIFIIILRHYLPFHHIVLCIGDAQTILDYTLF
jgi:hypothetical protein